MKRLVDLMVGSAVILSAVLAARALAADVNVGAIATLADGGTPNTLAIARRAKYSIQCAVPSCYATGTSTPVSIDCATAAVLPGTNRDTTATQAPYVFDSAAHSYVTARSVALPDAGVPATDCQVFQSTKNP